MKRIFNTTKILIRTNSTSPRKFNFVLKPSEWKKAISEAEKMVGYSTSFLSLRCLLSDELSNVAVQVKKLVGTGHPLLKTAQQLFKNGKPSKELRGLLILLLSKAAGPTKTSLKTPQPIVSGIYQSQRTLAEITEIIHTALLVHRSVIDIDQCTQDKDVGNHSDDEGDFDHDFDDDDAGVRREDHVIEKRKINYSYNGFHGTYKDLEFGNKMSTLSGDFLLASASTNLASLKNSKVVETISTAIQDLMEGEFLRNTQQFYPNPHDNPSTPINYLYSDQSQPNISSLTPNQPLSVKNWEEFTFLTAGSLLARGCQSALELANHDADMQQGAFDFGKLMAFAYQLKEEIVSLSNPPSQHPSPFFVPLIIYTQQVLNSLPHSHNTEKAKSDAMKNLYSKSPKEIYSSIESNSFVMGQVGELCCQYGRRALKSLQPFDPSPAKSLLINMINAVVKV